ncbi:hypothetical protein HYV74_01995 [Candidatus Uhrbacteria bacterium]|nr:hypothetical protein [Candidatus Uhrbacteria bacterium]
MKPNDSGVDYRGRLLQALRKEQFALVRQLSELCPSAFGALLVQLRTDADLQTYPDSLDPELLRVSHRHELEATVHAGIVGYTEWLGAQLWRAHGIPGPLTTDRVRIPKCDGHAEMVIVERMGGSLDRPMLRRIIGALQKHELALPCVGKFTADGDVIIDHVALIAWADCFDWHAAPDDPPTPAPAMPVPVAP